MKKDSYFDSPSIGSSLLGDCIQSYKPLVVCTDRATKEKKPTTFMEMGKIFEDLVEAYYSRGMDWFWDKYFKSNFKTMPGGIIELLEAEDVVAAVEECINDKSHYKLDGGLKKTYERKIACLSQIKAHDYRRPIPTLWWQKLEIMLERFGNFPLMLTLDDHEYSLTVSEWIKSAKVLWQKEFFWKDGEAKCRAKFDMIWLIKLAGDPNIYAVPFDIKCTGDEVDGNKSFGAFLRNWLKKYIWQSKHYHEGFLKWCEENGYIAYDLIWYLIQESEEPQITHAKALHPMKLEELDEPYHEALPIIQRWIDDQKPIRGYMPQQTVNEYGREWRE